MNNMKIISGSVLVVLFLFMQPAFSETLYNVQFINSSDKNIYIDRDSDYCMNDAGNAKINIPQNESRTMDLKDSDTLFGCSSSDRYVNWSVRYPDSGNIVRCGLSFNVDVYVHDTQGAPVAWYVKVNGCNELVKEVTCSELVCHNKSVDFYAMKNKNIKITFQ
ncbi:hypothetical protein [Xenorhabdus budapestensis]|uniref:Secreted protein n=1 Tax=Xenorhabdus budapestensis TaxID=290110 RepID=A0A2D0IPP0_XENBU|nr:hypothetical protein [Xenorhabdus budapestensis]PHM23751.1 hypothetical protein Xbud_03522 [Xenorhabdus budapestensis]